MHVRGFFEPGGPKRSISGGNGREYRSSPEFLRILYISKSRLRYGAMKRRSSTREFSATVGLCWLIDEFSLHTSTPAMHSEVPPSEANSTAGGCNESPQQLTRYVPRGWIGHLRFALRHEPIALDVYSALFRVIDKRELTNWIRSRPASTSARRAWYLCELLSGERLDLPDLRRTAYVDLLSSEFQITGSRTRVRRQRIYDNLLGPSSFSPVLRRTENIERLLKLDLPKRADEVAKSCTPSVLVGAIQVLAARFFDRGVNVSGDSNDQIERFVSILMRSSGLQLTNKQALIHLQNAVVGPNDLEHDWRNTDMVPILSADRNGTDVIFAKPGDLENVMNGWLEFVRRVQDGDGSDAMVMAAVAACAFLLIRPFARGNRRMHILLIHHILTTSQAMSAGTLSLSAASLKNNGECVKALERVSMSMATGISSGLDPEEQLYRYFDATPFVEYVLDSINTLVSVDLPKAIRFFMAFGPLFHSLPAAVDFNRAALLVRELLRCGGRSSHIGPNDFDDIPAECLKKIERVVTEALQCGYDPQCVM